MKRTLLLLSIISCSAPRSARTIEPAIEPGGGSGSPDDSDFILSRDPKGADTGTARADFPIHLEEKWWPFRAEYLGISVADALNRDMKITNVPPQNFWDEQTAIEAVSIWSALCNECHGGRRKLKDAIDMHPPPAGWGVGEGWFFGRSRPYVEIYKIVHDGGPERDGKPSEMPNWGARLSREQLWSLIYFIWFQSGGVKGNFPPSLHPRPPDEITPETTQ